MKYVTIPGAQTIYSTATADGQPLRMTFAEYLDGFILCRDDWRTRDDIRSFLGVLADKFRGEFRAVKRPVRDADGRLVRDASGALVEATGMEHLLDEGSVVELTHPEHDALVKAAKTFTIGQGVSSFIPWIAPFVDAICDATTVAPDDGKEPPPMAKVPELVIAN